MTARPIRLIDDRLLVGQLLSDTSGDDGPIATTSLWYYRACRASVLGAGGQLSGPFARLDRGHQQAAIRRLLELDVHIELPDPRLTVPVMARLAERHTQLNLLNLEAAATALTLDATVLLSPKAALGVLPHVLDDENVEWQEVEPWLRDRSCTASPGEPAAGRHCPPNGLSALARQNDSCRLMNRE